MRKDKTKIIDSVQNVTGSYIAKKISTNKQLKRIKQDFTTPKQKLNKLSNKRYLSF